MLFVRSPHVFRRVLMGQDRLVMYTSTKAAYETVARNTIVSQDGSHHRRARKLLGHGFTPKALDSYTPNICKAATDMVQRWSKHGSVDVHKDVSEYLFASICWIIFGRDLHIRKGREMKKQFTMVSDGIFALPINLPFATFGRALTAKKALLMSIEDEIERHALKLIEQEDECECDSLIDHILKSINREDPEHEDYMSLEELKCQLLTLMWAGYETAASALTQTIVQLANRPEMVDRMRKEQQDLEIASSIEGDAVALTEAMLKHQKQMQLHDGVVMETIRMNPIASIVVRRALKAFKIGEREVQPGWQICLCVDAANAPELAEPSNKDRSSFCPERYNQASGSGDTDLMRWRSIQFGAGTHYCLGSKLAKLECRALLSALVARPHRYIDVPAPPPEWIDNPGTQPVHPLKIRLVHKEKPVLPA